MLYGSLVYFINILVKVPWWWTQHRPKHDEHIIHVWICWSST